jgi:aryl-alcohol dehydrogenase-like predicted oxidoreductase
MRTRPLGKTGLRVSPFAIGTWGLSGEAYGSVPPEECARVIHRAIDLGVNLIDTSDAYGAGAMEVELGKILDRRSDVYVVTRGGVDRSTQPGRKHFGRAYLEEALERSLKRLGRQAIDVYLLHNPSVDALASGEATMLMDDLVKAGKIVTWGVSVGTEAVGRAAIDAGAKVISIGYNILHSADLHRISGDVMVSGVGVLARHVLAYGLLSGGWEKGREFPEEDHRSRRWTQEGLARRIEQVESLRFLVRGEVPSLRAAAVRFVLANHLVSSAIVGPKTVLQLEQLVREVGGGPMYLRDDALLELPRVLERVGVET